MCLLDLVSEKLVAYHMLIDHCLNCIMRLLLIMLNIIEVSTHVFDLGAVLLNLVIHVLLTL